jgi:hypothetical protein
MKACVSRFGSSMGMAALAASLAVVGVTAHDDGRAPGWVAGDFHQHTTYTDGSNSFKTVMYKNNEFGLDWWANSEHGGTFGTDARGPLTVAGPFDVNGGSKWTDTSVYPVNPIIGGGTSMWRWQSLRDFAFLDTLEARESFDKPILQSYEWNVPGHEHCSLGLIKGQFAHEPSARAIAQFEYLFDASDKDTVNGAAQDWPVKDAVKNAVNDHGKALEALAWLQANYPRSSYAVIAHPERKGRAAKGGYDVNDFRDFNNAAPDVAFGFESMPGHQKEAGRGGYGSGAIGGGTFGGVGAYAAAIGGLWDAMLGEGRHWWLFASSDFHATAGDFWPGEYQKTYTYVADKHNPQAILNGLRSGNTFVVTGDLVNALDFHVEQGERSATMGETLRLRAAGERDRDERPEWFFRLPRKADRVEPVVVTIRFKSPAANNHGDRAVVDHVDLIAGQFGVPAAPGTPAYTDATNPTAQVIKTFTKYDWKIDRHGWHEVRFALRLEHDTYFRLRGTNLAPNTLNETDAAGNPLADALMGGNTPEKAWADLWFYSNPVFVQVKK